VEVFPPLLMLKRGKAKDQVLHSKKALFRNGRAKFRVKYGIKKYFFIK